jgi:HK97 family phage major capsid protein
MKVSPHKLALMAAAVMTLGNRHFRINCDEPDRALAGGGAGTGTAVADPTQAVVDAVAGRIDQSLTPILQRVTQLEGRLAAATQAQSGSGVNPGQFLQGRAPAGHTGERASTSRGYQFQRLMGYLQGQLPADQCKVEQDVSNRLMQVYVKQGGMELASPQNAVLCPLSADFMPDLDDGFRSELRQSMAQGVSGADPEEYAYLVRQHMTKRQAMSIYDDTAGGVFLGPTQQGDMVELIRAREAFSRVGATTLPLPPNGRLSMPRETGAGTAYWVGEGKAITSSDIQTGSMSMAAKKLAVLYKLPNELLRFAVPAMEAFIRNSMARTMALRADSSMMDGVGTQTSPKGLLNYSGIKTVVAETVGANGNTLGPNDPGKLVAEIEEANFDPELDGFSWMMRPKIWNQLHHTRTDIITAGDGKGEYLFAVNREDIAKGAPRQLEGYNVLRTSQVPKTRSKGSSSALTAVIGGIFSNWLIGRIGVLEVATSTQGDTAFVNDQTWVRMIQHMDAVPRYEDCFGVIDTLVIP